MAQLRLIAGDATPSTRIGNESTSTTLPYILDETIDEDAPVGEKNRGDFPTADDVRDGIIEVLGYTSTGSGEGKIERALPLRHPYPGLGRLWAQEVDIVPLADSLWEPQDDANLTPDAPSAGGWALYKQYLFNVSFTRRRYALLPDRMITKSQIIWFNFHGDRQKTNVFNEWDRWVDVIFADREDLLSATVGNNMVFETNNPPAPEAGFVIPVDRTAFSAQTSMRLPNSTVKIHWYQVPYSYVSHPNSFLKSLKGTINQLAFLRWGPGELLYLNYTYNRNDKPITAPDDDGLPPLATLESDKLCDIEMTFIAAEGRVASGLKDAAPANGNYVRAGHNLQPNLLSKRYHYARASDDTKPVPSYLSAPHQVLFQDPQVVSIDLTGE